jgi:PAS domain S-box-containing protein
MTRTEATINRNAPSLRTRYITLTLILGLLAVSTVLFFYRGIHSTKQQATSEFEGIHQQLNLLASINNTLVNIYRNTDLFLLDPSQGGHAALTGQLITTSIQSSRLLGDLLPHDQPEVITAVERLGNLFSELNVAVSNLIESRMNIDQQYPGMAISADQMLKPQHAVSNNLLLLIDEIESGGLKPLSAEIYPSLLKTHSIWISEISQMRIYLANRLASFSSDILIQQAASLDHLHHKLLANIQRLEFLYASEDSFEGLAAIRDIASNVLDWHHMFQQVRAISESGQWRSDSHIMQSVIIPQTDAIAAAIANVENLLNAEKERVSEQLEINSGTLNLLLFIIILLFLLFISAIIFSLDRMIFKPISAVVNALELKALGKESPELCAGKSREIGYLINAYQQMDQQVSQRQEALHNSEQLLLAMAENYPNAYVSIIESDLTVGFTSGQEYKKLGVNPDHYIGQTIEQVFGEQAATIRHHYQKAFAGEESTFELTINNQHQLYHAIPLQVEDGSIPRILAVVENITDRKLAIQRIHESEKRYRTIFEGAPEGVWLIGPDRRTLEVNRRLCEILGYQREEIIGKVPMEFADEENQKIFKQQTGKIGTTDRREYAIELRHKDGHNIPTYFSASTLFSSSGEVLEAVAFVTDLTEQKGAETALRRAQKMDAIGQLTGGIAHDFNNLLGIILGNLELLERQLSADEKLHKRVASIRKASERAVNLTKQLLSFSRDKAAQLALTDINQVIAAMDSLISRSITPKIEVEYRFSDALWQTEIDPGDFEDTLLNLIINARDAMSGHGHLTIETRNTTLDGIYCERHPTATPGEYVELAVSDSGIGIPHEQQEHIFEPFFTTKEQGKGTGLGLSMVFGFIKRSRGCINVYSEPGVGTTFRIYLPRAEGDIQATERHPMPLEALPTGSETILAVDDESALLELAREALEALGYRVLTATDGSQALQLLDENPTIDLLFSDVVMPGGINGYELAEEATSRRPELKVLLTSGYTERAISRNGQVRFDANLLSKPYTYAELAHRVHAMLKPQQ